MIYRQLIALTLGLLVTASGAMAQEHAHSSAEFTISCSESAQEQFETGLALLHHMMYEQAADHFSDGAASHADCSMAHWGLAMTQLHPLWAPPSEAEFERGQAAAEQASQMEALTEREDQYISAIATYYSVAAEDGHQAGLRAWEQAHAALYETYPDDVDAGAFSGLAHLATAPSDDATFAHQKRAGALFEELLEEAPRHPGLFHYLIHAYDNPALARRGAEFARGYDELAPEVPHALHMPSHIFVRLGLWPDVIEWNRRSADAALQQPAGDRTSHHYSHALDYLMYAYLQQGQNVQAREVLDEITAVDNYQVAIGAAYNIPAARARYLLERREWEAAATLAPRIPSNFPWDDFPHFEAITYWARGLGAAQIGDLSVAQDAVDMLDILHERTLEKDETYWAGLVDMQRKTVEAWILYTEGEIDQALARMEEAADQEDAVDKHPVTPGAVLPARELYGDMLMQSNRPEDARVAYQAALKISPNRFNSLYGMAHAAEMAGEHEGAQDAYAAFAELTKTADTEREEVTRAKSFLAEN